MNRSKIANRSLEPDWRVARLFDPAFLDRFVVAALALPSISAGGLLPRGSVTITRRDWLGSVPFHDVMEDIGCGMSHAVVDADIDLLPALWNELYRALRNRFGTRPGEGTHFVDGCVNGEGDFVVLVNIGSRMTGREIAEFDFERDYLRFRDRALENHGAIWEDVSAIMGSCGDRVHLVHNDIDIEGNELIVRKGAVRTPAGAPVVIGSSFEDVVTVGSARASVADLWNVMVHGSGRRPTDGPVEATVDQRGIRRRIIIPDALDDTLWRSHAPQFFRGSDEVSNAVDQYIEVTDRLVPIAFMGGF
ncbi:MAG: RNA-splicing ligase RtcB [Chlorobi bacterium]|nr:RNA-splicing ligase RtcB [Chlorobiota bacterium]